MLGEYPCDITEVGVVRLSEVGGDKLLNPPPELDGAAMDAIGVPPNSSHVSGHLQRCVWRSRCVSQGEQWPCLE